MRANVHNSTIDKECGKNIVSITENAPPDPVPGAVNSTPRVVTDVAPRTTAAVLPLRLVEMAGAEEEGNSCKETGLMTTP